MTPARLKPLAVALLLIGLNIGLAEQTACAQGTMSEALEQCCCPSMPQESPCPMVCADQAAPTNLAAVAAPATILGVVTALPERSISMSPYSPRGSDHAGSWLSCESNPPAKRYLLAHNFRL